MKTIQIPTVPEELEKLIKGEYRYRARLLDGVEFKTVIDSSGQSTIDVWAYGGGNIEDGSDAWSRLIATLSFSQKTERWSLLRYENILGTYLPKVIEQYYQSQDFTFCPTCGSQIPKKQ